MSRRDPEGVPSSSTSLPLLAIDETCPRPLYHDPPSVPSCPRHNDRGGVQIVRRDRLAGDFLQTVLDQQPCKRTGAGQTCIRYSNKNTSEKSCTVFENRYSCPYECAHESCCACKRKLVIDSLSRTYGYLSHRCRRTFLLRRIKRNDFLALCFSHKTFTGCLGTLKSLSTRLI